LDSPKKALAMPSFGLLVTSRSRADGLSVGQYSGAAAGDPWPFQYASDLSRTENELLAEISRPLCLLGLPEISGSPLVVYEALDACAKRSISVRLLLCSGENIRFELLVPRRKELLESATFLGVDIVTCDCNWSCVLDDFDEPATEEIHDFKAKLNENGLFTCTQDAIEYLAWRNEFIRQKRLEAGVPLDGSVLVPNLEIDDVECLNVLDLFELPLSVAPDLRN
jgi:hypothetical protein